jgi:hypothetical protein
MHSRRSSLYRLKKEQQWHLPIQDQSAVATLTSRAHSMARAVQVFILLASLRCQSCVPFQSAATAEVDCCRSLSLYVLNLKLNEVGSELEEMVTKSSLWRISVVKSKSKICSVVFKVVGLPIGETSLASRSYLKGLELEAICFNYNRHQKLTFRESSSAYSEADCLLREPSEFVL